MSSPGFGDASGGPAREETVVDAEYEEEEEVEVGEGEGVGAAAVAAGSPGRRHSAPRQMPAGSFYLKAIRSCFPLRDTLKEAGRVR